MLIAQWNDFRIITSLLFNMQFSAKPGIKSPEKLKTDWWSSHAGSLAKFLSAHFPLHVLYCMFFWEMKLYSYFHYPFLPLNITYIYSRGLHCWSVNRTLIRGKRFSQHMNWAEPPEEQSDIFWHSLSDGWNLFSFSDCVQFKPPQFSHRPQLLFDLLLWTLCQKWFNFCPLDQ